MSIHFSRRMLLAGSEFAEPVYEILSYNSHSLTIKVYTSIASGLSYMDGKAKLERRTLRLFAETCSNGNLEFELINWELVFTMDNVQATEFDVVLFNGKVLRKVG